MAAETNPRLFEVKGLGGAPPDASQIKVTGVKSEPIGVHTTGHRIPKGATVKLIVYADVEAVAHEDVFETIDGLRMRSGTVRLHACKATDVELVSWTAPDDNLRFADGKVGPHLAAAASPAVKEAVDGLKDSGVSSISSTIDGKTTTVDLETGEVTES